MSQPFKICPQCNTSTDLHTSTCGVCGRQFRTQFPRNTDQTILGAPNESPPYQAPPQVTPVYPPPYQQPPAPLYHPPPVYVGSMRRTDACAVLSVVFSTIGILLFCCFGWILSLVGSILGLVSLIRIYGDSNLDGKVLAWLGLLLGLGPLLIWIALLLIGSMSGATVPSTPETGIPA
ncbi:MAG: hypothetical protein ACO1SX_18350 [Actinomycetota bacterium]